MLFLVILVKCSIWYIYNKYIHFLATQRSSLPKSDMPFMLPNFNPYLMSTYWTDFPTISVLFACSGCVFLVKTKSAMNLDNQKEILDNKFKWRHSDTYNPWKGFRVLIRIYQMLMNSLPVTAHGIYAPCSTLFLNYLFLCLFLLLHSLDLINLLLSVLSLHCPLLQCHILLPHLVSSFSPPFIL